MDGSPRFLPGSITRSLPFIGLRSAGASRRSDAFWLLLVIVVALLLCLPFVRTVHALGAADEGVILLGADRLLHGQRLYGDFFEFLPPGSFLITAGWFAAIGTSLWAAQSLAIMVIVAITCLIYLSCRQVSGNPALSALIAIAWPAISPLAGFFILVNHHWFATLFSMMSAWAVFSQPLQKRRRLTSPFLAGLAAGAAGMVTPTRGAAAALAAATAYMNLRRHFVEAMVFVVSCAVVPLCLLIYLIVRGDLLPAYQDVLMDWRACWRDERFLTCVAFGLAGWVGFLPRPDIAHIYWSAPLVSPLISYCASRLTRPWRSFHRYMCAGIVIALCLPAAFAYSLGIQRAFRADIVSTPRGEVTFSPGITPGTVKAAAWLSAQPIQDKFFFYPYLEMLPFLLGREQISKYDLFVPDYTTPAQYEETCFSVMREATWVVIDRSWKENPRSLLAAFPAIGDPSPPEVRKFEQALDAGFEQVARFGTIEIRRRRQQQPSEAACAGISP
jgi:hypothetical protein